MKLKAKAEIAELRKALKWCIDTLEIVQRVAVKEAKLSGFSPHDSDEFKWVKSLLEKQNDNDSNS